MGARVGGFGRGSRLGGEALEVRTFLSASGLSGADEFIVPAEPAGSAELSTGNTSGQAAASVAAAVNAAAAAVAPANLQAAALSSNLVLLTWSGVNGASSIEVFRFNPAGSSFTKLVTLSGSTQQYSAGSLAAGNFYLFAVRATYADGSSAESYVRTITPQSLTQAPTNLSTTPVGGDRIDVRWATVSGATGIQVFVFENGQFRQVGGTFAGNVNQATVTDLDEKTG